jgi:hypothetical protein
MPGMTAATAAQSHVERSRALRLIFGLTTKSHRSSQKSVSDSTLVAFPYFNCPNHEATV